MKNYATEARSRWSNTDAYREHEQKTKNYTKKNALLDIRCFWQKVRCVNRCATYSGLSSITTKSSSFTGIVAIL